MADDLLNSLLGSSDDDEQSGGLADLLGQTTSAPGAAKDAGADALGGLASMLGGGGGGNLGALMGMLGGGGGGGGGIGSILGGLTGGGGGGGGGADYSQLPVVGPIINSLADKLGIPPAQASALVTSALTMLMSRMNRSGASRMDEIDLNEAVDDVFSHLDIISKAAEESGLDHDQAAAGVQEAMKMLADATQ